MDYKFDFIPVIAGFSEMLLGRANTLSLDPLAGVRICKTGAKHAFPGADLFQLDSNATDGWRPSGISLAQKLRQTTTSNLPIRPLRW